MKFDPVVQHRGKTTIDFRFMFGGDMEMLQSKKSIAAAATRQPLYFFFNLKRYLQEKNFYYHFTTIGAETGSFRAIRAVFSERKFFHERDEKSVCKFITILQIFTTI